MAAPAEGLQPADDAFLEGIERRDQRRTNRCQHDQQHERGKKQRNRIVPQPIEYRLPVTTHPRRRDRLFFEHLARLIERDRVGHQTGLPAVRNLSSPPRKRGPRACPWLEQGKTAGALPLWIPAFAGMTEE